MLLNRIKQFFLSIFCILFLQIQSIFAQDSTVEMATGLRANGKIYVVVVVLCVIFIGLILYLISIDKKVSKLEKEIKNLSPN